MREFQIICNIVKVNKYFVGILWISLPTKYMKLNVQRILMILQYINIISLHYPCCRPAHGDRVSERRGAICEAHVRVPAV